MAIIGDTALHSLNIFWSAAGGNGKVAVKLTLPIEGYVTKISQRMSQTGGNRLAKAVIYSVSAGEPDVLLATSEEKTISNTGEARSMDFFFSSPVYLAAGDYFFGVIADTISVAEGVTYGCISQACQLRHNNDTYSDGAANPFGSASTSTTVKLMLYVEYQPAASNAWLRV